jgi:hypothetical protein
MGDRILGNAIVRHLIPCDVCLLSFRGYWDISWSTVQRIFEVNISSQS